MRHMVFTEQTNPSYPVCLLVSAIQPQAIKQAYLSSDNLDQDDVLVLDLFKAPGKKKTPMAEMRAYFEEEIVPVLRSMQVEYLLVSDADYFKAITRLDKTEANLGYVIDSPNDPWKVVYVPSYQQIFYDPIKIRPKIAAALHAVKTHREGAYAAPGADIIHYSAYPETVQAISDWLDRLIEADRPLAIDIEGFGLKHYDAGIGTICFCWSKHEGIAFAVDYQPIPGATEAPFGLNVRNEPVRQLLKRFFQRLTQKAIYHSISYDVYVLIYQLFMKDILDTEGLLEGLGVMLDNWDCTKLITYLATNSCAGNRLGLKDQAQEFSGNWAVEVKDITTVPLPKLLQYNLIDGLSTWFVHEKHRPTMIRDQQLAIYEELFQPAIKDIIQMQLTGMPVNMARAKEVDAILAAEQDGYIQKIRNHSIVKAFTDDYLDVKYAEKMNAQWKKKRITPAEAKQVYNPNSDQQTRALLFDYLKLPVINLTESKQPSTDGESIEALLHRVTDPAVKELLEALQMLAIVSILTSNFMPSILGAVEGPDGWHYLFGNFNLGGTLSGRLSSSGPNLQNLPSTGKGHPLKLKYAKLIKSCFAAPPGWLFIGIDFASLEDRISALTTKDPNKLAVYQGHIVYAVDIDGVTHHIRDDDTIIYDGKTYNGQSFYAAHSSL